MRLVTWLELAFSVISTEGTADAREIVVRPIGQPGNTPSCFGLTLDQRWLCGTDGMLTIFDSLAAATRFLELLGIERFAVGAHGEGPAGGERAAQCLRLDENRLALREHGRRAQERRAERPSSGRGLNASAVGI